MIGCWCRRSKGRSRWWRRIQRDIGRWRGSTRSARKPGTPPLWRVNCFWFVTIRKQLAIGWRNVVRKRLGCEGSLRSSARRLGGTLRTLGLTLGGQVVLFLTMSTTAPDRSKKYSRASQEAGDRLLKAVKEKLLKEKGKIDYAALRRGGYSQALISRLKEF